MVGGGGGGMGFTVHMLISHVNRCVHMGRCQVDVGGWVGGGARHELSQPSAGQLLEQVGGWGVHGLQHLSVTCECG